MANLDLRRVSEKWNIASCASLARQPVGGQWRRRAAG
eukprot:SAG25_NODE_6467_length_557_cov_0.681223_2_plen_36_part_01